MSLEQSCQASRADWCGDHGANGGRLPMFHPLAGGPARARAPAPARHTSRMRAACERSREGERRARARVREARARGARASGARAVVARARARARAVGRAGGIARSSLQFPRVGFPKPLWQCVHVESRFRFQSAVPGASPPRSRNDARRPQRQRHRMAVDQHRPSVVHDTRTGLWKGLFAICLQGLSLSCRCVALQGALTLLFELSPD